VSSAGVLGFGTNGFASAVSVPAQERRTVLARAVTATSFVGDVVGAGRPRACGARRPAFKSRETRGSRFDE
jgi:hypothetical protein